MKIVVAIPERMSARPRWCVVFMVRSPFGGQAELRPDGSFRDSDNGAAVAQ
ncbi:MAG: hypothetical protein ABSH35_31355 [Isosphaeraceae bacterium]